MLNIVCMTSYKVLELIGTSDNSWEDAVRNVVRDTGRTVRDMRRVEVVTLDAKIADEKVVTFRAKVKVSFKLEDE